VPQTLNSENNEMVSLKEIVEAYSVEKISVSYDGEIEITDLKKELGTRGHVLVIRGDLAYANRLNDKSLANPKFWLYKNLVNSQRVQEQLRGHPEHKLFDGVGFSALEALGYHSRNIGRKAVVVMAREMLPPKDIFERYDIEIIHGDKPMEKGYVEKQAEVISQRNDLIPLHQALYGAQSLASIGNRAINQLEKLGLSLDATLWCIASGSNLYGLGRKIKHRFPNTKTIVVEPERNRTIDSTINLSSPEQVRKFAKEKLRHYFPDDWDKKYSGVFPLHASSASRYLLLLWAQTGDMGFDRVLGVATSSINRTQRAITSLNPHYDWTKSTALTLAPAVNLAKQGKNVLVMAYGKNRETLYRDLQINGDNK